MPVAFWFRKGKFFGKDSFSFQVFYHFFHGDMIVGYGRCFAITDVPQMFQCDNKRGLVCFSAFGDGKWMAEL